MREVDSEKINKDILAKEGELNIIPIDLIKEDQEKSLEWNTLPR